MRNLLGRLHARSTDELARIAAFWQVLLGGDRPAQVAALYRTLTDPRAARSAWDRLTPDERELVRLLAVGETGDAAPTLAELADRLGVPEAEARERATRLYRIGILAREGDDDPLPVGATPRLFLPRELAQLFRRVQDEIDAGDLSDTPLRALLELLDDAEVEEAAAIWGLHVVPGLRGRDDLTRQLLRRVGDAGQVAEVASRRRRDAARLWQRVRDEPNGAPVPLAAAAADAGLGSDDPRAGQRLRAALAELETALLVWHTYRPDGSRWLFVPAEIRAPRPAAPPPLPPLAPVAAPPPVPPPWRHPDALAWDLLTLLRDIADPFAPPWPAEAEPPRSRLRRLNRRLWHRDDDVPPAGYLDLLAALGEAEGLLARHDDDRHATLTTTPAARGWRNRTFPEQTTRLRWWWLASTDWVEGRSRGEVEVWGADWRGARRKLLAALTSPTIGLEPGAWYALESVTTRIAVHDPDLLGSTFTAATARHAAGEDGRAAAIAEVVAVEFETALAWFGLAELADIPRHGRAVRLTDALRAIGEVSPAAVAEPPEEAGPALVVTPAGEVELHVPSPLRVWALSAFAEPVRLDRVSVYRLSAESLERALSAGFDLEQVTAFLSRQGRAPLPPPVAGQLDAWARGYRRVRLHRAVVLTPDDPDALAEITHLVTEMGLATHRRADDALLVELAAGDDAETALLSLLRERGYSPQWAATPLAAHLPTTMARDGRDAAASRPTGSPSANG